MANKVNNKIQFKKFNPQTLSDKSNAKLEIRLDHVNNLINIYSSPENECLLSMPKLDFRNLLTAINQQMAQ